jgi:hypothetical protein
VNAVPTLVTRLNAEWKQLCAERGNGERVRSWLFAAGVLREGEAPVGLDELCTALRRRSDLEGSDFSDVWMRVLLHQAAAPDGREARLGARVLFQAMLPCARRMIRSTRRPGEDLEVVSQLVVASLWEVVRSYPVARRPRRIAAGLRMELWHRVSRELRQELAPSAEVGEERLAECPDEEELLRAAEQALLVQAAERVGLRGGVGSVEELKGARGEMVALLVWALEREVLTAEAASGICAHFREGAPRDAEAARVLGVTPVALRRRRSRAVAQLRQAAPQWGEAA